ncbi:MAG: FIST N-terminal domain-containing protein [Sulfuritalea sp.]|nr:FIST N-terminal domain-containing protein [Sulfuritalea sp.]
MQRRWTPAKGWTALQPGADAAQLALVFGGTAQLDVDRYNDLRADYPGALVVGCSTAGEIADTSVSDDTLVVTALTFAHSQVRLASARAESPGDDRRIGAALAAQLLGPGLVHVFVLSDGLHVNGTELAAGLQDGLPSGVAVTGGLSGDGARFSRTLVVADAPPAERVVAAVGFYGDRLKVGYGSLGGWDPFGPDRLITKSAGNVLYELDGEPALALYKRYLGEHAAGLPASGLLFPLALRGADETETGLVRTILAVDEADGSMTFAGDVPQGTHARLMKANFDRLIEGAAGAARASLLDGGARLAVLISCVGRKLVLGQRIEEEIEGVRRVLGNGVALTGFYSYGEISPYAPTARCELHNQTMTITSFAED